MPQTLFLGGRPLFFLIILLCVSPFLYGGGLCDPNANCIVDFGLLGKASDPLCESKKLLCRATQCPMILQDVQKHESKILNDLSQTQESINNKQALLYEMVSQSQQNQVELNLKNKEVQTLARLTNTAYLMATEFYDIPILFAREIQKQEPPHSSLQALNRSKNPRDSLVSSHGMNDVFNLNESILKSKKYSKALMQSVFMVINNQREWKKFLSKLPNPSIEDQTPQNVYHWIKNIYQIKLIDFEKSLAHQNQLDGDIHSLQSELDLLNNHNKQLTFELNQQQKRKCSPL